MNTKTENNSSCSAINNFTEDKANRKERVIYIVAVCLSILHLYFNIFSTLSDEYISSIHFAGYGILAIMMIPLWKKHGFRRKIGLAIDFLLIIGLCLSSFYFIAFSDALAERGYDFILPDWIASIAAIAISLELVRRSMGWIVPCLICVGLSYVLFFGPYVEGVFHFAGLGAETVLFRNYFDDGLFGPIAKISWSFVFMFILFGSMLVKAGTGDFIMRLASASVGRFIGGPGLVSIVASGLMGSVSGSAIANTAATGVITIPMMKKSGFPAKFAAAVEAGASTGGQLIPPVMGAGVFIMSSYTQIPYLTIVGAAFLPGLLYFCSIAVYVRIQAKRLNLKPMDDASTTVLQEFKTGWHHLLPITLLLVMMGFGYTPTYAAGCAAISIWIFSWFSKTPMGIKALLDALADGSKNCMQTAVLLVAIGVLVNCISISSLGVTFSFMISEWAGSNLLLMLLMIAVASLIIGMGLPVTASYIVLATLAAPAIYNLMAQHSLVELIINGSLPEAAKNMLALMQPAQAELLTSAQPLSRAEAFSMLTSLPPEARNLILEQTFTAARLSMLLLSAHMIIFWLSQDSNVTPPVCLVAFTAASIAKTPPMATGVEAWKTAKSLYIVPLLFAYTPFIGGSLPEMLKIFVVSLIGIYALVAAIYGYAETKLSGLARLFSACSGVILIWPTAPLALHLIIGSCLLGFLAYQMYFKRRDHHLGFDRYCRNT